MQATVEAKCLQTSEGPKIGPFLRITANMILLLILLVLLLLLLLLRLLLLLLLRAFPRFLPEEPVGGYTEVQKAWQAWTLLDFGPTRSVQDGRGEGVAAMGCACVAQFGREVFCPQRPLEVRKPWQARTFAVAELAPSMTLKSYWVQKP